MDDAQGLVECLEQSDRQLAEERKTMTSLAKLRLKNFAPESFAMGLKKACEYAVLNKQNSRRSRMVSHFLDIAA